MPSATFITLNTLRVLSILSLALSIATCIIVNVKGFPNLGHSNTLFQFINRSIIALEALFLIFAEIGWPKRLYTWFPMLDDDHSWSFFGFLQIVMGSLILGYDSGINSEDFFGYQLICLHRCARLVHFCHWDYIFDMWFVWRCRPQTPAKIR